MNISSLPEPPSIDFVGVASIETVSTPENRLYSDLIHDGLLMREQMQYMAKMKSMYKQFDQKRMFELLDRVPDIEPILEDCIA